MDDDDRVSLAGLDPEEALRALLKVDPEAEPVAEWVIDIMAADEQTGDYPGVGDPSTALLASFVLPVGVKG
jgi:hypothetical protein